eukprot:Rhum_TRINITY_DN11959_c1_g1::Rhum_TRINITY_DN11959_c1_g1_i1::g.48268::m.48268
MLRHRERVRQQRHQPLHVARHQLRHVPHLPLRPRVEEGSDARDDVVHELEHVVHLRQKQALLPVDRPAQVLLHVRNVVRQRLLLRRHPRLRGRPHARRHLLDGAQHAVAAASARSRPPGYPPHHRQQPRRLCAPETEVAVAQPVEQRVGHAVQVRRRHHLRRPPTLRRRHQRVVRARVDARQLQQHARPLRRRRRALRRRKRRDGAVGQQLADEWPLLLRLLGLRLGDDARPVPLHAVVRRVARQVRHHPAAHLVPQVACVERARLPDAAHHRLQVAPEHVPVAHADGHGARVERHPQHVLGHAAARHEEHLVDAPHGGGHEAGPHLRAAPVLLRRRQPAQRRLERARGDDLATALHREALRVQRRPHRGVERLVEAPRRAQRRQREAVFVRVRVAVVGHRHREQHERRIHLRRHFLRKLQHNKIRRAAAAARCGRRRLRCRRRRRRGGRRRRRRHQRAQPRRRRYLLRLSRVQRRQRGLTGCRRVRRVAAAAAAADGGVDEDEDAARAPVAQQLRVAAEGREGLGPVAERVLEAREPPRNVGGVAGPRGRRRLVHREDARDALHHHRGKVEGEREVRQAPRPEAAGRQRVFVGADGHERRSPRLVGHEPVPQQRQRRT